MPVGNRRHGKSHAARDGARDRRRHHPRQHLSSDVAARGRAHRQARGLHRFMGWDGPILTDSGGYQVMSLSKLRRIEEHGVTFQSHIDGATHLLTPERAIEVQCLLGADIQMVLDECTPFPATRDEARSSMELSMRWAERSKQAFQTLSSAGPGAVRHRAGQHLSGLARAERWSSAGHRLRRLRDRRACGWRRAGGHARHRYGDHVSAARGSAALSHGRGHARRICSRPSPAASTCSTA